jgi:hypothetical protein
MNKIGDLYLPCIVMSHSLQVTSIDNHAQVWSLVYYLLYYTFTSFRIYLNSYCIAQMYYIYLSLFFNVNSTVMFVC